MNKLISGSRLPGSVKGFFDCCHFSLLLALLLSTFGWPLPCGLCWLHGYLLFWRWLLWLTSSFRSALELEADWQLCNGRTVMSTDVNQRRKEGRRTAGQKGDSVFILGCGAIVQCVAMCCNVLHLITRYLPMMFCLLRKAFFPSRLTFTFTQSSVEIDFVFPFLR